MNNHKPLTVGEIEMDEICTLIHHETPSHCCGCYIIQYGNGVGLRALCNECGHSVDLLSLLPPPPDAAVREAVESLEYTVQTAGKRRLTTAIVDDLRALLRAVQAPRLTAEQVEAVRKAGVLLDGLTDEYPGHRDEVDDFKSAFPEAFGVGEVGRG